jgi:FkbM family methyltransferase
MATPHVVAKPFLACADALRTIRLNEVRFVQRLRLLETGLRAWGRVPTTGDRTASFDGGGHVRLAATSLNADWNTFSEIFLRRCYDTDFRGATVIDVGAHKGYFGAFALLGGAHAVYSFEPESQNFQYLEDAARSFQDEGYQWVTSKVAIGSKHDLVELQVSGESWTHSLLPLPGQGSRRRVGIESVPLVPLQEAIEREAVESGRLVVKVDVEGSECDVILGTTIEAWRSASEVFVETHSFAPCSSQALIRHLRTAGHAVLADSNDQVVHLRHAVDR